MRPTELVVILTSLYGSRPLHFHRLRPFGFEDHREDHQLPDGSVLCAWVTRTRCGRIIHESRWTKNADGTDRDDHRSSSPGTYINYARARLIAEPCSRCFPGGIR